MFLTLYSGFSMLLSLSVCAASAGAGWDGTGYDADGQEILWFVASHSTPAPRRAELVLTEQSSFVQPNYHQILAALLNSSNTTTTNSPTHSPTNQPTPFPIIDNTTASATKYGARINQNETKNTTLSRSAVTETHQTPQLIEFDLLASSTPTSAPTPIPTSNPIHRPTSTTPTTTTLRPRIAPKKKSKTKPTANRILTRHPTSSPTVKSADASDPPLLHGKSKRIQQLVERNKQKETGNHSAWKISVHLVSDFPAEFGAVFRENHKHDIELDALYIIGSEQPFKSKTADKIKWKSLKNMKCAALAHLYRLMSRIDHNKVHEVNEWLHETVSICRLLDLRDKEYIVQQMKRQYPSLRALSESEHRLFRYLTSLQAAPKHSKHRRDHLTGRFDVDRALKCMMFEFWRISVEYLASKIVQTVTAMAEETERNFRLLNISRNGPLFATPLLQWRYANDSDDGLAAFVKDIEAFVSEYTSPEVLRRVHGIQRGFTVHLAMQSLLETYDMVMVLKHVVDWKVQTKYKYHNVVIITAGQVDAMTNTLRRITKNVIVVTHHSIAKRILDVMTSHVFMPIFGLIVLLLQIYLLRLVADRVRT